MREPWFTPGTATETLARLRPAVGEMRRLFRAMILLRAAAVLEESPVSRLYFRLLLRFEEVRDSIRSAGAVIRDPSEGRIDFPARLEGRPVWLCWRAGEPSVAWWHDECGSVGRRRPIADNAPWERPGD